MASPPSAFRAASQLDVDEVLARTREHLDWIADEILDAGGCASIWIAHPGTTATERDLVLQG